MDAIRAVLNQALNILTTIQISDVLDILIVGYLIYKAISLIRRTNSNNLAKGLLLLFGVFLLSELLGLDMLRYLLRRAFELVPRRYWPAGRCRHPGPAL